MRLHSLAQSPSRLTVGMEGYGCATHGDFIADVYDDRYLDRLDPTAAASLLAELAGDGRALELGIGTGRVALPLAARGVPVIGILSMPPAGGTSRSTADHSNRCEGPAGSEALVAQESVE